VGRSRVISERSLLERVLINDPHAPVAGDLQGKLRFDRRRSGRPRGRPSHVTQIAASGGDLEPVNGYWEIRLGGLGECRS
jgi:hypothetical protein